MMTPPPDSRRLMLAWGMLVALTVVGTALSLVAPVWVPAELLGLGILVIAWAKARILLLDYLGLRGAPSWRGGAVFALSAVILLLVGLRLAG
jgi:nitric oxide reductase NorF protein